GSIEAMRKDLDGRVLSGSLSGYLIVRPSALKRGEDAPSSEYRSGNLLDMELIENVKLAVREAANARLVSEGGIPKEAAAVLTRAVPLELSDVRAQGKGRTVAA